MMIIKVKIYDDLTDRPKTQQAIDKINAFVNGDDIKHPWDMFEFQTEVKVLINDFSEDTMNNLFPNFTEYPQISFAQGDKEPIDRAKFTLDEIDNALRNLHSFIQ